MRLKRALLDYRCSGGKQYTVAMAAGVHPSEVSRLVHDAVPLRDGDERVKRIARALGVPESEAFEPWRR